MCALTLLQCSSQMAEALVKGDIHLILFGLLCRIEEEDIDVTSLANSSHFQSPEPRLHSVGGAPTYSGMGVPKEETDGAECK